MLLILKDDSVSQCIPNIGPSIRQIVDLTKNGCITETETETENTRNWNWNGKKQWKTKLKNISQLKWHWFFAALNIETLSPAASQ